MTMRKITHIQMSDPKSDLVEKIVKVKFEGLTTHQSGKGEREVLHVIQDVLKGTDYYCIGKDNTKSKIEVVSPSGRGRYIRSTKNNSEKDNLLSLPHF